MFPEDLSLEAHFVHLLVLLLASAGAVAVSETGAESCEAEPQGTLVETVGCNSLPAELVVSYSGRLSAGSAVMAPSGL